MAESAGIGPDEREVLKLLALDGAMESRAQVTCSALGERLDVSTQTVSRRLQRLEDAELIDRQIVADGQLVGTTEPGEQLLRGQYADYRRLFEQQPEIRLTGEVTSGMGEGSHYISLPGYMRQFITKLGYEPFAGTLNVELDEPSIHVRADLESIEPVRIDGWENDDRTYGPAFCWSVAVEVKDQAYEPAHIIAPERTHHADDQLELIAPEKLRAVLDISDGDELTTHVEK